MTVMFDDTLFKRWGCPDLKNLCESCWPARTVLIEEMNSIPSNVPFLAYGALLCGTALLAALLAMAVLYAAVGCLFERPQKPPTENDKSKDDDVN